MENDIIDVMDSQDTIPSPETKDSCSSATPKNTLSDEYENLQEQVIANFQKPNLPNVNVPEKIIICLDVCYEDKDSAFRLNDGTTYTRINMLKRVLDFFIYSKHAINKKTEFALLVLKDSEPSLVQNFTNNVKDILNAVDYVNSEDSTQESFCFQKIFELVEQDVEIPVYKQSDCIVPPPYIVRMIVLYARSNCIPVISHEDTYFNILKKELYFFIDIMLVHKEDCAIYKCEEVFDALQLLDTGYSYVFEVSRNATKVHDCIVKLLAHPLQRPLQKDTDYSFGSRY